MRSPLVLMPARLSARNISRTAIRFDVSSPTPGARRMSPSRFTVTSVPSGKTVSVCAAITTVGPPPVPLRTPLTLSMSSVLISVRPSFPSRREYTWRGSAPCLRVRVFPTRWIHSSTMSVARSSTDCRAFLHVRFLEQRWLKPVGLGEQGDTTSKTREALIFPISIKGNDTPARPKLKRGFC